MILHAAPLLTQTEEARLARRWGRHGDLQALHRLVERNLGLAYAAAGRFRRYGIPIEDRRQAAAVALVVAARSYDASRGRFAPFARRLVRCALIELASRATRSGVHVGGTPHRRRAVLDLGRVLGELAKDGVHATPDAIASRLGVSSEIAAAINAAARPPVQLDEVRDDGAPVQMLVADSPDPEQRLLAAESSAAVSAAMGQLTRRERTIVRALHVEGEPPRQLAIRLGMRRADVLRIAEVALAKLREQLTDGE